MDRAARGDPDAFERLYRGHVARVHTLARRIAGEDVADDLTQEVFLRAWTRLSTFRGDSAFGTWLHRLAVNLILSRRQSLARRRSWLVEVGDAPERARGPEGNPGLALDFERAIARLPAGAREVFVLFDVEGFTHAEIAAMLGVSVGTSKSQLHRARMLLRGHLA